MSRDLRNHFKRFCLDYEKKDWELVLQNAKICKMKPTEYIREMSLNGEIKFFNTESLNELSIQLNRIGTNINQIVHLANEVRSVNKTDIEDLKYHMKRIDETIKDWCKPLRYEEK
jgi:hypothetical protein